MTQFDVDFNDKLFACVADVTFLVFRFLFSRDDYNKLENTEKLFNWYSLHLATGFVDSLMIFDIVALFNSFKQLNIFYSKRSQHTLSKERKELVLENKVNHTSISLKNLLFVTLAIIEHNCITRLHNPCYKLNTWK